MNLITQLRTKSHARHLDHGADIMGMRSYRFEQLSWSIRQGSFFLHESMEEGNGCGPIFLEFTAREFRLLYLRSHLYPQLPLSSLLSGFL